MIQSVQAVEKNMGRLCTDGVQDCQFYSSNALHLLHLEMLCFGFKLERFCNVFTSKFVYWHNCKGFDQTISFLKS